MAQKYIEIILQVNNIVECALIYYLYKYIYIYTSTYANHYLIYRLWLILTGIAEPTTYCG